MRRDVRAAAAASLLLLAAAAASPAGGGEAQAPVALRTLVRPGEAAPAFALEDLQGRAVPVKPGDGRPALIVFFSAFCPLCRELAPSVGEIAAHPPGTLRVIWVNLDGRRFSNAVRSFVTEYRISSPVLLDEIRNDMFLASDPYGVEKTPTAVLVDGRGFVRASRAGEEMRDFVRDSGRILALLENGKNVPR